ncbi:PREDICTED: geminin-like isoform X2 [Polistes dominula]|uniref:Geminin-like isoform X2 n=1 Tax=Polistes dominula TaxID=743375 RepID=A0ABM1J8G8_POLDO|nr:PREDICTED: geminin-like isoform X2 [Polistes dominula]
MKPTSDQKVSGAKIATSELKLRESLHDLQPTAMDKENLVGGGRTIKTDSSIKDALKKDIESTTEKPKITKQKHKKVICKNKAVQTSRGELIRIDIEDLTSEAGPSENYWQVLAERRRIALHDALDENKALHERIATLQEENRLCNEMLNETRALVEVLQEMIEDDDSNGIHNSLEDSAL